eukprot:3782671-Rhodomonas_salina.1
MTRIGREGGREGGREEGEHTRVQAGVRPSETGCPRCTAHMRPASAPEPPHTNRVRVSTHVCMRARANVHACRCTRVGEEGVSGTESRRRSGEGCGQRGSHAG